MLLESVRGEWNRESCMMKFAPWRLTKAQHFVSNHSKSRQLGMVQCYHGMLGRTPYPNPPRWLFPVLVSSLELRLGDGHGLPVGRVKAGKGVMGSVIYLFHQAISPAN